MRGKIIVICGLVLGAIFLCAGAASQEPGAALPADCKNKERLQYRSSGSFVGDDTSKVNCTVDYWICDRPYSKSKIVKNVSDVQQLRDEIKRLEDRVKQLEDRLNGDDITLGSGASNIHISNKTDDKGVSMNSDSGITIKTGGKSVSISSSGDVSIKASGTVSLKGSRVTQN